MSLFVFAKRAFIYTGDSFIEMNFLQTYSGLSLSSFLSEPLRLKISWNEKRVHLTLKPHKDSHTEKSQPK